MFGIRKQRADGTIPLQEPCAWFYSQSIRRALLLQRVKWLLANELNWYSGGWEVKKPYLGIVTKLANMLINIEQNDVPLQAYLNGTLNKSNCCVAEYDLFD